MSRQFAVLAVRRSLLGAPLLVWTSLRWRAPLSRLVVGTALRRHEAPAEVCVWWRACGVDGAMAEYGIYLDGEDKPEYRTQGISHQLDALGDALER